MVGGLKILGLLPVFFSCSIATGTRTFALIFNNLESRFRQGLFKKQDF